MSQSGAINQIITEAIWKLCSVNGCRTCCTSQRFHSRWGPLLHKPFFSLLLPLYCHISIKKQKKNAPEFGLYKLLEEIAGTWAWVKHYSMFSSCLVFAAEQVVEGREAFRAAAAANNSTMRTVRMTQSGEVAAGQRLRAEQPLWHCHVVFMSTLES